MDRNVLWLLKKIPEIEDANCPVTIEDRLKISFNLSKTGAYLTLIANNLGQILHSDNFKSVFDDNCGRCTITESKLQKYFKYIQTIDSFNGYFREWGLPEVNDIEMNKILLTSITNSKVKGYHGRYFEMNKLPDPKVMIN